MMAFVVHSYRKIKGIAMSAEQGFMMYGFMRKINGSWLLRREHRLHNNRHDFSFI